MTAPRVRPEPVPQVEDLQAYPVEGAGRRRFLRCDFNENPRGCSPAVLERLRRLSADEVALYPDETEAREAAARFFGLAEISAELDLLFTAGVDEGIRLLADSFAGPGRTIVLPAPAFSIYAICADLAGARRVEVSYREDLGFPVEEFRAAVATRGGGEGPQETKSSAGTAVRVSTRVGAELAILPDPNNPTCTPLPSGLAAALADEFPRTLFFVDEAYAEYSGRTSLPDLAGRPNLVIGRTFSKAYGLAGLRLGVLVGNRETLGWMGRARAPYAVAAAGLAALPAALADREWVARSVAESREALEGLRAGLSRLGVWSAPTSTNFTIARFGPAAGAVGEGLRRRGCLVKRLGGHPLVEGCLRISPGTSEISGRFLRCLEETLREIGWKAAS